MEPWILQRLMLQTWTRIIESDLWYGQRTHGINMDSWFRQGLMVQTWTHSIGKDSWYGHRLMVLTHGTDNTLGIDLHSWYRISTPESHTYKRAKCCPYKDFFNVFLTLSVLWVNQEGQALIAPVF